MKKIIICIIILLAGKYVAFAQSTTTAFNADGIKVIFKPTLKDIINVRIYYRGGVNNYPSSKAGIENFALQSLINCGTKNYAAAAFKDSTDKYGINMNAFSTYDFGYVEVNSISKYFNNAWSLFTDAIMNPAFEDDAVQLLKANVLANSKKLLSSPADHIYQLSMQNAFGGTAYMKDPNGTEASLSGLTADELKSYYSSLLNKNKIFIVIVGNISKEEIYQKVLASFNNIPVKEYIPADYNAPVWNDNKLIVEKRQLSTNYINAVMNAPAVNSADFIPFRLGISAISNTLYTDLRRELKLTYNVGASTYSRKMSSAEIYINTDRPKEAITEILKRVKSVQAEGVDDEWLLRLKNGFVLSNFQAEQSSSAITNLLGLAEINGGWQYADDLPQLIYMATSEQVMKALNTYIVGLRWAYLGNEQALEGFTIPPY